MQRQNRQLTFLTSLLRASFLFSIQLLPHWKDLFFSTRQLEILVEQHTASNSFRKKCS
nr:MAG TPA: hypothetical protein [Caudoviricetes sp.]